MRSNPDRPAGAAAADEAAAAESEARAAADADAGPDAESEARAAADADAGPAVNDVAVTGTPSRRGGPARRGRRWPRILAIAAALILAGVLAAGALLLRGSLARTGGEFALAGLAAPVEVERDGLGIARIRAESLADALAGQGFVHAQDRYFQMDLNRRFVAGELAALFGADALPTDRRMRRYRYRARAAELIRELPPDHRDLLIAYTAGVNAGLASLRVRPPEYLVLRSAPEPWRAEDTVLSGLTFMVGLSTNHAFERPLGVLRETLPEELFEFLTPDVSRWDAPVTAGPDDPTGGYAAPRIPGPGVVDLRGTEPVERARRVVRIYGDLAASALPGSNNWALAGSRTRHGGALVANDPHLGLSVPNTWHRSELEWAVDAAPERAVVARGAGMPGLPGILIGATDHLAWGFTNAVVDQTDLVVIEVDPADPGRYLTPDGTEAFRDEVEVIGVRGGEPDTVLARATRWGPVIDTDWRGRPLALRSTAWDPDGMGFEMLDLFEARNVDDAVEILRRWGAPAMSGALGDSDGRVAFAVTGPIPRRVGFDGKVPVSWAEPGVGWNGRLPEADRPVVADPPSGFVFTANNRLVELHHARRLSRVWVSPSRARRIMHVLSAGHTFDEPELLRLQLDTRSIEHEPARALIMEAVPPVGVEPVAPGGPDAATPRSSESVAPGGSTAGPATGPDPDELLLRARELARGWTGRADAEDPAFRLLQAFNEELRERLLVPLLAPALAADPRLVFNWPLAHEATLRILDERPAHLLPPGHTDWVDLLRAALRAAVERLEERPGASGLDLPWGEENRASIRHPFGGAGPLARLLDMPEDPLPGWAGTVRAQSPSYGASLRMIVDPAQPETGVFHMPGGQSGHFLSRHYRAGHDAWVGGRASPFLAGEPRSRLRLVPERR